MMDEDGGLANVHPGEVLREEFLTPYGLSVYRLAKELGVPQTRLHEIVKERRGISADTAGRLARFFGTSMRFWQGLQAEHDAERLHTDPGYQRALAGIQPWDERTGA